MDCDLLRFQNEGLLVRTTFASSKLERAGPLESLLLDGLRNFVGTASLPLPRKADEASPLRDRVKLLARRKSLTGTAFISDCVASGMTGGNPRPNDTCASARVGCDCEAKEFFRDEGGESTRSALLRTDRRGAEALERASEGGL